MANGFYEYGMQAFARGEVVWKASAGSAIRTALVDTADYTVNLTTHDVMSDVAAGSREETSANMTLVDAAPDGVCAASDVTFTGTTGDQCEGILVYRFTTNDAGSVPLFWWDTASGLPVTLGGDVTIAWDTGVNKIARIQPVPVRLCLESGCGELAVYRGRCRPHARRPNRIGHTHGRIYGSKRWQIMREWVLSAQPLCPCGLIATDVDHIVAIEDGGAIWAQSNLQGLCAPCHGKKTAQESQARGRAALYR